MDIRSAVSAGSAVQQTDTPGLDAVRSRRAELRGTLDLLELALSAPASGRAAAWTDTVRAAMATLAGDFAAHIEVTEGPHGLHQAILAGDVRLANAVQTLTRQHAELAGEIASLVVGLDGAPSAARVAALRERCTLLLGHLIRHRQRGADLIYEAYATDIGGAD